MPNVLRVVIGSAQLLSAVPETAAPDAGDVLIEAHLPERSTATATEALLEDALPGRRRRRVVHRPSSAAAARRRGLLSMLSPPDRLEPLLRMARDKADGGLVRVESVRRAE